MSDIALLNAVERRLRAALGDAEGKHVGVQPDGAPPSTFGQWYAGIDETGYSNIDPNPLSLDEQYGVVVMLTVRMDYAPKDRRASRMLAKNEMRDRSRRIVLALHADYDVLGYANAEITAANANANGFIEPLCFKLAAAVTESGPEWHGGTPSADGQATVYVRRITFGGARRVQKIEGAT